MANLTATPDWTPVRQLDRDEFASGGPNGNMNEQAKALLNRIEYLNQQKADKEDIIQGQYRFATLAEFNAVKATIPVNSTVIIDEAGANQGTNTWNGTTLTKSAYDLLTQAKADATVKANAVEQQLLVNAFGRYGFSKNLVKITASVTSSSSTTPVVKNWTSARDNAGGAIAVNGLFAAVKLDVLGASYPDVYNDLNVFTNANTSLRVQLINNGSILATLPLTRIAKTDAWYFWDKLLNYSAVTEIKIFAQPKDGVTITLSNAVIQNDGGIANVEILKRDEAIAAAISTLSESVILSNAYVENLLDDNSITTSTTVAQLEKAMTTPISKYSAVCILDCDGVYPTTNSSTEGFKARIEIRDANASYKAAFLKRIGNSKVWYVSDADASHPTPQSVKISAVVPAGSTSVTIKNAVITGNSIPNPIHMMIRSATSASELTPIITPIVGQKVEEAVNALDVKQYPMTAIDAIRQAETRRVDIVTIGDSNNQHSGYGFEGALRNALTAKYGLYATGIVQGVAFGSASGAPSELSALSVANVPYNYVADGEIFAASSANGLNIDPTNLYMFDTGKQLRLHASYGTFNSGGGSFRLGARLGASPYSVLQMGSLINTNTGQIGRQLVSLDVNADPTRAGKSVEFKYAVPGQTQITGPFISYFMRVEDPNANSGICVSTIYSVGGQNLWNMATRLLTDTNAQLTTFFSEIRRLQLSKNQKPIVVIYINSALNDRNGTNTSLGWRASTAGDSPTAYIDNLEVITKRISDVWQMNGWDETELFFWIVPSHPVSTPDDSELLAFRKAAYSFCQNRIRTSFTDFTNFVNESDMTANDWYLLPTDHNHLKKAGYDALINLIADSF